MIKTDAPDAVGISAAVRAGRTSAEAETRAAIARIEQMEPALHAWETFAPALALEAARDVDRGLREGRAAGLLAGVPIGVKDIFDTADLPTGHGSPIYKGHRPAADAHAVAAARAAGAVVMGKTVTTEFAYFTPGPTANPRDPARTPGGSSSGSAAAVASGMVPLAFGSQTAGSLIRPASYCGVFALKPTHDRFSLEGVKGFAPSLDTLGWLARTADDLELMRAALSGVPYVPLERPLPTTLRIGVCRTHEWPALDAGGRAAWDEGLRRLADAGVQLRTVEMPHALAGLVDAQKTIMAWEAARGLAVEHRDHASRLSAPILELVQRGLDTSDDACIAARVLANLGRREVARLTADIDALLVPAAPGEAPLGLAATGDPVFSRVWTLLGLPCVNVPGLAGPHGMPVGLQLVGTPDGERPLLRVAAAMHHAIAG
jgi:Asp-tRNA(Asn)/Glu-tRNA(Gln) amidotransferase A subunit family amidase